MIVIHRLSNRVVWYTLFAGARYDKEEDDVLLVKNLWCWVFEKSVVRPCSQPAATRR